MESVTRRAFVRRAAAIVPFGMIPATLHDAVWAQSASPPGSAEFLKEAITKALKAQKGEAVGGAIAFLAFGGHGVPGLVDGATLSLKAGKADINDFTQEHLVSLGADLIKDGSLAALKKAAAKSIAGGEVALEGVVTVVLLFIQTLFTPSELSGLDVFHGPPTSKPLPPPHSAPAAPAPAPAPRPPSQSDHVSHGGEGPHGGGGGGGGGEHGNGGNHGGEHGNGGGNNGGGGHSEGIDHIVRGKTTEKKTIPKKKATRPCPAN